MCFLLGELAVAKNCFTSTPSHALQAESPKPPLVCSTEAELNRGPLEPCSCCTLCSALSRKLLAADSCCSCRQFKCSQRAAGRLHIHLRCLCMLTNAGHLVPTRAWLGEGQGPVPLPPWFCSLRACRSQWDLPAQTEHRWWAGFLVGSF